MSIYVPPNGFTGAGQQTQAASIVQMGARMSSRPSSRRRKRKATAKRSAPKRTRTKRASSRGKLVKGSAAAKRRMAALRRMRKR